jgi:hypothetical protein
MAERTGVKARGVAPKQNSQRRRRNKPKSHGEATPAITEAAAFRPELGIDHPTPQIRSLWDALQVSAEARFYSDADWHRVRIELTYGDALMRQLSAGEKVSAQAWTAFQNSLTELLVSPASKRRAGIDVRPPSVDPREASADAAILSLAAKLQA